MPNFARARLHIQWSITVLCDQRCRHCYMHESPTYASELNEPLGFQDCCAVIDDLTQTARRWGMSPAITFTGGDPLLRNDLFAILEYANKSHIESMIILGNPYHVDRQTARALKRVGVFGYQISIDGMEEIHDQWRRPGSFAASIRALQILQEEDIAAAVMFTLSRDNADQLVEVLRLAARLGVDFFAFDRLVCSGQASGMADEMLSPNEMRALFDRVHQVEVQLRESGSRLSMAYKTPLWKLYAAEQHALNRSLLEEANSKDQILGGCHIGGTRLAVLADGTVYPCRRLPLTIGKVPQESVAHILLNSSVLQSFRDLSSWEKCRQCDLRATCRGCPAVAYGATGSPFGPDPQCWRELDDCKIEQRFSE